MRSRPYVGFTLFWDKGVWRYLGNRIKAAHVFLCLLAGQPLYHNILKAFVHRGSCGGRHLYGGRFCILIDENFRRLWLCAAPCRCGIFCRLTDGCRGQGPSYVSRDCHCGSKSCANVSLGSVLGAISLLVQPLLVIRASGRNAEGHDKTNIINE